MTGRQKRVYGTGLLCSVFVLAWLGGLFATAPKAAAQLSPLRRGYFTGANAGAYSPVIHCHDASGNILMSLTSAMTDKDFFIETVKQNLTVGRADRCPGTVQPRDITRNRTGAQFIIQTMRGVRGAPAPRPDAAAVADWEMLVRQPDVMVSWEDYTFTINSAYAQSSLNDDTYYLDRATTTKALVFKQGGEIVFVIKESCANPIDIYDGLVRHAPTITASGNCSAVSGRVIDPDSPGAILDVHVYYNVAGGIPPGEPGWSGNAFAISSDASHNYSFNPADYAGAQAMDFYIFAIGVDSSGIPDGMNGLAGITLGPCNNATCRLPSNFPATMGVGETYYLKPQIDLDYPWGSPYTGHPSLPPSAYNPTMHVSILGPTGVVYDEDVRYDAGFPTPGTRLTANPSGTNGDPGIPFTPSVPGTYQLQWSLSGLLNVTCPGVGSFETGNAGFRPYFEVVGGDILSGGDIRAWNRNGDPAGNYMGGGSQLAALAMGNVDDFITGAGLPGSTAAQSGRGLAFANTTASGNRYGGGYAVSPPVPTAPPQDFTLSGVVDLATLGADGTYYASGNITLHGQLSTGRQVTIVVRGGGNVFIDGNITYGSYNAADPSSIPRLTVIVQNGNVSVRRNVTEIHGVYYVQGSGAHGNFYSCTDTINTPITFTTPDAYNLCNNSLSVYGAVSANRLVLGRTYGTYHTNSAGTPVAPAESFLYTPELWLAPDGTSSDSDAMGRYDSFVSLPPIL
ncbi:hypothetical protein CSA80_04340 [Candidatus Saccharibacteria bacterium]|nr:MAG: hypothetical protein CR973_01585 [Candidatus Saccharibacteria bacterium]PID98899.1 MAG: hypothetical protein CSA80_04340 [Candidatus Saccharibacteria bacterium]